MKKQNSNISNKKQNNDTSDAKNYDKAADLALDPFANNKQGQMDYPFGTDSQN